MAFQRMPAFGAKLHAESKRLIEFVFGGAEHCRAIFGEILFHFLLPCRISFAHRRCYFSNCCNGCYYKLNILPFTEPLFATSRPCFSRLKNLCLLLRHRLKGKSAG